MPNSPQVPKQQLLKLIDELEKNPNDKVRIMGDAGLTIIGAGLGAAAATTLATATGVTSIAGITTAASWVGLTIVAATPVGWIIASAALAGATAYGVSRLIRGGGLSEGRKAELLQGYREEARKIETKELAASIEAEDRTRFILSLRELIDKNVIPSTNAFRLIEQVEQGRIALSQAFELIQLLLQNDEAGAAQLSASQGEDLCATGVAGANNLSDVARKAEMSATSLGNGISDGYTAALAYAKSFGGFLSDTGATMAAKSEPVFAFVTSAAGTASEQVTSNLSALFQKAKLLVTGNDQTTESTPLTTEKLEAIARETAPVIWMLGKTGAGKTSIIATLTGSPHAEVGNGYVSCTRTAKLFDFPQDAPLMRFLDTRGLGEAGYDPDEDLAWHHSQTHLVLVVMKVSDPTQEDVVDVISAIRKKQPDWPILVVQTGLHELYPVDTNDHPPKYPFTGTEADFQDASIPRQLRNALTYQRGLFSGLNGEPPLFVPVDFTPVSDGYQPPDYGRSALIDGVLSVAPEAVRVLVRLKLQQEESDASDQRTQYLNMRILYWAAGASAVGVAPVVGLVTVPATQGVMLAQLATEYGVEWDMTDISALAGMLGVAIVANQGALLAIRQLAKLGPWVIPIAAAQDYAVTYALGRAACVYLQARKDNTDANAELVKAAFQDGLRQAFSASGAR